MLYEVLKLVCLFMMLETEVKYTVKKAERTLRRKKKKWKKGLCAGRTACLISAVSLMLGHVRLSLTLAWLHRFYLYAV